MLDLLVRNALIVDGTGSPPYRGSVGVKDGAIAEVGKCSESASRVVDIDGLVVAPGFWDVHTHYDAQLLWDPIATSSSWHGVTTVVMGNCGFTIAPCRPDDQEWMVRTLARVEGMNEDVVARTLPWTWETYGQYLDLLDTKLGINALVLAGHSAIRRYVMGPAASDRPATEVELTRMKETLATCIRDGAAGFSTSRVITHADGDGRPVPSRVADLSECYALAEVLRDLGSGYVQLAVGSDFNKYSAEGRQRLAHMAERSGRPVCINGVTQTPANPKGYREILDWMAALEKDGHAIFGLGQVDPGGFAFNLKFTNVFDRYPGWQKLLMQPHERKVELLRDPRVRADLLSELERNEDPFFKKNPIDWRNIRVTEVHGSAPHAYEGKDLVEVGRLMQRHPMDAMFELSLDGDLETQFTMFDTRGSDESVQEAILKWPHIIPEQSDAGAHVVTEIHTGFPSYLLGHWVREKEAMSLEEAVWRLTALPASELHVTNRGHVKEGMAADLVVFDPATINSSQPTFVNDLPGGHQRLVQYSEGVHCVVVNGVVTLEEGQYTGATAGTVIRRNQSVARR